MGMFTNYDLTPNNYTPSNLYCDNRVQQKPKLPLVEYDAFDNPIGFTWNYGDTVYLEFSTVGNVVYDDLGFAEEAETYLQGKKFEALIYNFRYEVVAKRTVDAATCVRILSDSFYPSSLVKGVYHLQLNLIDEQNGVRHTLVDGDNCTLFIK